MVLVQPSRAENVPNYVVFFTGGSLMQHNEPLAQSTASADIANNGTVNSVWNEDEQQNALRWRRAILKLSETLLTAADEHRELSPFLLEAMHYALENLLVYGDERDLMALEEWLVEEGAVTSN
jgi:hypothetical protein